MCEWVPDAETVAVVGDFNEWNETSHVCTRDDLRKFRLTILGQKLWRTSPWTKYAVQIRGSEYAIPAQTL